MMINLIKCVIFSRVSTSSQSLDSQNAVLYQYAHKEGYNDSEIKLIEQTESAVLNDIDNRIGIQQLFKLINETPSIKCVIVHEISRIARRPDVLYKVRDFLLEHKIQLICLKPEIRLLDDKGDFSQSANLIFSIFSSLAESEGFIRKERFLRAKNLLKSQGKKFSGRVVFGYMKNKDKYCVPHPTNSKIIVDLFNHYLEDKASSAYELYKYACMKYPSVFQPKNYTRDHRKIMSILTKNTYIGNWCYPELISKEIFDKAQEKLSKAKCNPRYESKCKILGRGKVFCGYCGRMLTGVGGSVKAYKCSYKDGNHNVTVNTEIIDNLIWEETRIIANINASIDNKSKIMELSKQIEEKQILLEKYESNIAEIEQKLSKLLDLYINNKVNSKIYDEKQMELNEEMNDNTKHIDVIKAEINSLQDILEKSQKDLLNYKPINYDSIDSFEVKQELVRKYIDKVIVTKLENKSYDIRFTYNTGLVIVQEGKYRYEGVNQHKRVYRINADGTTDRIL